MGVQFTKQQLLDLAKGIGQELGHKDEEKSGSLIIRAAKTTIENIDTASKERAVDILLEAIEKAKATYENNLHDGKGWELLKGSSFILGVWRVQKAVPIISTLLKCETWNVRNTAAIALQEIIKKEES
ncbi:MAG: hypothetical protein A3I88_00135 [Candidatus Portnoybacteria bacterium RIFCSPLOWO2_12_FULL_39_9]|uniref:HEAT repeat domain-containing protein n=1 Tax=Candidatus Portnoybacteria bacterium RIFCSPHIGHO2_12_FULL_38_9 TaxID=1801997 RepID=A0A1G2FII9_9BACT|nr:MAG: hypothetical protein A3H00_03330 [Candidatus Portnoybacteria bacterium RBG_13_40_8]OGZ37016.1 MAG: hypothetical protein A2646_00785 [Candidatus Portnoybacteria bacterium RIFCSPHIGHO2_02_FULL_39_12]OGZ37647.1 MAG: hypothetical protein A3J64_00095 [Candidatus Portnoybacteria bacterium RIFCSPHIGHO2_12_FULL_38_9]OGZ39311.1 MAG: hypothetical protein A3F21_02450 [Candidatus Portnoybacteria bacterium RIFCSPLOWO2_01_FULL_38_39]OGZ39660.1 MAG: hypothetical protein A3I88_00135 [Candidatus Portnoy